MAALGVSELRLTFLARDRLKFLYSTSQLTDTCIKNGGDHFLQEIASKEFVSEMSNLIKAPVSPSEMLTCFL